MKGKGREKKNIIIITKRVLKYNNNILPIIPASAPDKKIKNV